MPIVADRGYWRESESPLASLIFLLPLIVVYECGTGWLSPGGAASEPQVIAFLLIRQFFALLNAHATHLPAVTVACTLLGCHLIIKDPWQIHLRTFLGMTAESLVLAVPMVILGMAMPRYFPLAAGAHDAINSAVIYCGAGIYEEFIFRLVLILFMTLILRDAFELHPVVAGALMVLTSGILFSAYHYLSPAEPPFLLRTFVFRSVAGIYFGVLFLTRGFGVTAATHAFYDIFVLGLALVDR
jgi:uncharacterized protein (DUF486 family)